MLCCHSNATHAPIANLPNSTQLGGSLYHARKLHPGPCSSVGVWPGTDTQTHSHTHTHTHMRVTTIHFASSTTHTKCKNTEWNSKAQSVDYNQGKLTTGLIPSLYTTRFVRERVQYPLLRLLNAGTQMHKNRQRDRHPLGSLFSRKTWISWHHKD